MVQGKIISITGTIELRKGKPEINVMSADQIKVFGFSAGTLRVCF
jgi:DNA/RNA endonuclease YhcR with UshA esterase domain